MEQKSGLKPGWQILKEALQDVLDPKFKEMHPEEQRRRGVIAASQIALRKEEILPKEHNDQLVDMAGKVIPNLTDEFPRDAYAFLVNHGGEEAIDRFIEAHPNWVHATCPCGCGAKELLETNLLQQKKAVRETIKGLTTLLIRGITGEEEVRPEHEHIH